MNMSDTENAFVRLQAEWTMLDSRRGLADTVRGWLVEDGLWEAGAGVAGLDELLTELKQRSRDAAPDPFGDRWMAALLRRSWQGGAAAELAVRVLVQAMVPGAIRAAQRLSRYSRQERDEVAQVVLVALFEVVRGYPLARRPRKIALNIALDLKRQAARELRGEEPQQEELVGEPVEAVRPGWSGGADPVARAELVLLTEKTAAAGLSTGGVEEMAGARGELIELLLWALREQVLEPAGARAVADHYRQGALGDEAAARAAGVSHAAWRQRRSRAVRRLRTAAPQWLEQAA